MLEITHPWLSTHWGQVTHIWVRKLTIIDSDNGLSPVRSQAIIWTNAEIILIGSLEKKIQCNLDLNSFYNFIHENTYENV